MNLLKFSYIHLANLKVNELSNFKLFPLCRKPFQIELYTRVKLYNYNPVSEIILISSTLKLSLYLTIDRQNDYKWTKLTS